MASSTVASLENIRKQRQLEMELVELDKQKDMELKALNQERLAMLKELCRIRQDKRKAQHLPRSTHGVKLTLLADTAQARLLRAKEAKELHKFEFKPDPVEKVQFQLPALSKAGGMSEIRSAREMHKHRVYVQKLTLENYLMDKRSRRRDFLDKSLINPRIKGHQRDSLTGPTSILRPKGAEPPGKILEVMQERGEEYLKAMERETTTRGGGGGLPGVRKANTYTSTRGKSVKPSTKHPSATAEPLPPVVKDATGQGEGQDQGQGQGKADGVNTSPKASAAAAVTSLPPVDQS